MIPNQAELEEYYIVQRFSKRYIANFCDISHGKVRNLMKRYGIRSRTLSEAQKGRIQSEETKSKIGVGHKGKIVTEETRSKLSKNHKGGVKEHTEEWKNNMKGKNNPNWKGGISFGEYCPAFNEEIKEYIRDKYNRKCFNCGMEEENERKLDVHHVDFNKMQGCNEHEWRLIPLCKSCHASATNNREGSERHYRIVLECL